MDINKASTTVRGKVEHIVKSASPSKPDLAQIALETDHNNHKEILIENTLKDNKGRETGLELGAKVEVTVTAEPEPIRFGHW